MRLSKATSARGPSNLSLILTLFFFLLFLWTFHGRADPTRTFVLSTSYTQFQSLQVCPGIKQSWKQVDHSYSVQDSAAAIVPKHEAPANAYSAELTQHCSYWIYSRRIHKIVLAHDSSYWLLVEELDG